MIEAKVLVASAEPALTKQIVSSLIEQGHVVSTTKSLPDLLGELERTRFDAVVVDDQVIDDDQFGIDDVFEKDPSIMGILILPEGSSDERVVENLRAGWTEVLVQPLSQAGVLSHLAQALMRSLRIRETIRLGTLAPLTAISEDFLLRMDLDALLDFIVKTAQSEARCDRVSLMLVEGDQLRIRAAVGLPAELLGNWQGKVGVGIAGYTAATGEAVIINRGEEAPRFVEHLKNDRIKSAVSLPMKVKGRVLGVLNITNFAGSERFFDSDVQLLSLLAGQAAVAIQNANLYNSLQTSYLHTIVSLANALEARDNYLSGHSTAVMKYAVKIAQKMKLPEKDIDDIRNASTLHDIGKIGIRDAILLKPGRLDDSEWVIVQQHPEMGSKIIAPVRHLSRCMPLILHHHERWDGNGYPAGLKGEEIPLGSRIIAVADTFDAMTSTRPYREAFEMQQAVTEIKRVAGKQLDPKAVDAFLEVLAEEEQDAPEI